MSGKRQHEPRSFEANNLITKLYATLQKHTSEQHNIAKIKMFSTFVGRSTLLPWRHTLSVHSPDVLQLQLSRHAQQGELLGGLQAVPDVPGESRRRHHSRLHPGGLRAGRCLGSQERQGRWTKGAYIITTSLALESISGVNNTTT